MRNRAIRKLGLDRRLWRFLWPRWRKLLLLWQHGWQPRLVHLALNCWPHGGLFPGGYRGLRLGTRRETLGPGTRRRLSRHLGQSGGFWLWLNGRGGHALIDGDPGRSDGLIHALEGALELRLGRHPGDWRDLFDPGEDALTRLALHDSPGWPGEGWGL